MSAKKKVSKSPTSFLLEEELLTRFRVACAGRKTTQSEVVAMAIERWLGETPEKDEQSMTNSTKRPLPPDQTEQVNQSDAKNYPKIVQKSTGQGTGPGGQETDQLGESEGERIQTVDISIRHEDLARIATALEEIKRTQRDTANLLGELAAALKGSEKTTKSPNRNRRLDSRRKRGHSPGAQSGA